MGWGVSAWEKRDQSKHRVVRGMRGATGCVCSGRLRVLSRLLLACLAGCVAVANAQVEPLQASDITRHQTQAKPGTGGVSMLNVHGHVRAQLNPDLAPLLYMWLRADAGVVTTPDKQVITWTDSSARYHNEDARDASRMSEHKLSNALTDYKQSIARDERRAAKEHRRAAPAFMASVTSKVTMMEEDALGGGALPAVSFPCALTAPNVQLRDGMTILLVLRPEWLESGDHTPGQRFFGHYPNGQFRFHDRFLAFNANGGDYILRDGGEVPEGRFSLAAYRFNGGVEISLNGAPFVSLISERGKVDNAQQLFSQTKMLTVGGVASECGFYGSIAEIMVFGHVLTDVQFHTAARYISEKYQPSISISSAPVADTSSATSQSDRGAGAASALVGGGAGSSSSQSAPAAPAAEAPHTQTDSGAARSGSSAQADNENEDEKPRSRVPAGRLRANAARANADAAAASGSSSSSSSSTTSSSSSSSSSSASRSRVRARDSGRGSSTTAAAAAGPVRDVARVPAGQGGACVGRDAFGGAPVETWEPPANASLEDIMLWEDERDAILNKIKKSRIGGAALRDMIHKDVRKLVLLRHNLFCKYVAAP